MDSEGGKHTNLYISLAAFSETLVRAREYICVYIYIYLLIYIYINIYMHMCIYVYSPQRSLICFKL